MQVSFAIKLGFLLILVFTTLTGGILFDSYRYASQVEMDDLIRSHGHVARTGSLILNEEAREVIELLRDQLYSRLPEASEKQLQEFISKSSQGATEPSLHRGVSDRLQAGLEYQTLVQLLRRVKAGSRGDVNSLQIIEQKDSAANCALPLDELLAVHASESAMRGVYLAVPIPGVDPAVAVMFLADSNYLSAAGGPAVNPIGNLYKPEAFFSAPFKSGKATMSDWYIEDSSPCISVMTAAVPIKNEQGRVIAVLGADYPVTAFKARLSELKASSWRMFSVSLAIAVIATLIISYWVAVPLGKLREGAEQLLRQDFSHRVNIKAANEFGVLAKTFNKVSAALGDFTHNLEKLVAERTDKLSAANELVVQLNSLLTQENAHLGAEVDHLIDLRKKQLPYLNEAIEFGDYSLNFHYLASRSVCGDFWETGRRDDNRFEFCIGQVSGYGLETAASALQLQAMVRSSGEVDLAEHLVDANRFMYQQNVRVTNPVFAKLMYVALLPSHIEFVGCGETPIVFNRQSIDELNLTEMSVPLGLEPHIEAVTSRFDFDNNSVCLLYSAGFRNAVLRLHGEQDVDMTATRFIQLSGLDKQSPAALLERLATDPTLADLQDDIAFILIEKKGQV